MTDLKVDSLWQFPIKGCRGIRCEKGHVDPLGFEMDRRWLATDENGRFLTQRECGALAGLIAKPSASGLDLQFDGSGETYAANFEALGDRQEVTVWRDEVMARAAAPSVDKFLSDGLGRPARLFFMDDDTERETSSKWGRTGPVSFADSFPLLVTTTASLAALNEAILEKGGDPVAMERFRPNIVIDGAVPWAEDLWCVLKIGDVEIELKKPCERCKVTTLDPNTGELLGVEPLATLAKLRRSGDERVNGVLFGWNASVNAPGHIAVGDRVEVVEERPEGWALA